MALLYTRYKSAPVSLMERLVIYLRLRFSSYEKIASYVPSSGQILDLGCGFGMVSIYLAVSSQARRVKGIDISTRRLKIARWASEQVGNVGFEHSDLLSCPLSEYDCILLIDTLHYFPQFVQNEILSKCYEGLKPGGLLILRDSNKDRWARHLVTRFHETIMTKSGFTKGITLCFRSFVKLEKFLEKLGFLVDIIPMWGRTPFADTLMICTKEKN